MTENRDCRVASLLAMKGGAVPLDVSINIVHLGGISDIVEVLDVEVLVRQQRNGGKLTPGGYYQLPYASYGEP